MARPANAAPAGSDRPSPGDGPRRSPAKLALRPATAEAAAARRAKRTTADKTRHRQARRQGAGELAHRLAQNAEAVCRHYLSNGRRSGGYWHVGDVANTPGQSLYVRLSGARAGKWCDAATAEHGDLLDLIAA